jgi:pilus assembly protein CpaD
MAGALVGLAVVLGACTHTDEVTTASVPDDYRLRHPIAIQEADRSVVIFVGHARGGLSASQRADVMGLAQIWLQEGTGAITADVPVDTPNARGRGFAPGNSGAALGRRRAAARDRRPPLPSG